MNSIELFNYLYEYLICLYEPAFQIYGLLWISWILTKYAPVPTSQIRKILEASLYNWTAILCCPLYPIGFPIFYMFRYLLNQYILWESNGTTSIMPGSDAVWGTESFANACNFTSLYVLSGECNREKITKKILEGIVERVIDGEKIYDKLKWKAGSRLGHPVWEKCEDSFDINKHVKLLQDWSGDGRTVYTEDEVFEEISKFFDHPLAIDKPQWEIYIVPKYVYNDPVKAQINHYALIFRIHHSLMDGISAGFALQNAIADKPPRLSVNPLAPLRMSRFTKFLGYAGIFLCGLYDAINSFTLTESNCFHGPALTGPKKLGWSKPVSLEALKVMKNKTKTSTTAVLMSALGASLRNLAISKKLQLPPLVHSSLTVAILPYPNIKPQNRFTVVLFPMNLSIKSTLESIQEMHRAGQKLARSSEALVNFYLMRLLGQTSTLFCKWFNKLLHATMLLSNVPGPAEKATVFDGDGLEDIAFWTPLRNTIGVSMSLFSYAGKVRVAMVGDSAVFHDPNDIPNLLHGFEKEIENTGILCGWDNSFILN